MIMKGLVILLLAVVAAESVLLPHRRADLYGSSLGGAKVAGYSRVSGGGPAFARGRFPAFFPQDVYASSLGGAPVGLYSREHHQRGRWVRPRLPVFRHSLDDVYLASLGGAKAGAYSRGGEGGRRHGGGIYGASLGGEKVGMYSRE